MFFEIPKDQIVMLAGALLIGLLLASICWSMMSKLRTGKRDPRDDRIRSLEAECRIARSDAASLKETVVSLEGLVEETREEIQKRDNVISHQQEKIGGIAGDLKESVIKTRELRSELSDRATQNIKSEVQLREVKTELEVAQASTDLIATGILDYSLTPEDDDADGDTVDLLDASEMSKAAN